MQQGWKLRSCVPVKPLWRANHTSTWSLRRGFGRGGESTAMETLKYLEHSQKELSQEWVHNRPTGWYSSSTGHLSNPNSNCNSSMLI